MADGKRVAWADRRTRVEELLLRHELEKVSWKQIALEAGIALPTLYTWVQRLRRERTSAAALAESHEAVDFIELKTPLDSAAARSASGIELSLQSGLRIGVAPSFHEPTLKRLLMLLGV